jgi:hypothetical protein
VIVSGFIDPRDNRLLRRTLFGMDDRILERRLLSRIIRRAFRPAYNTMRGLAGQFKKSGRLQKSIVTTTIFNGKSSTEVIGARLGPRLRGSRRVYHAHFVELGTSGGQRSTDGQFTYPSGDGVVRTSVLDHPGTKARPFVAPTYAKYKDQIPRRILSATEKEVAKYWNKNAPRF